MTVVIVTGTGTGVGKTIATAALASAARVAHHGVAVCKPVQTGTVTGDDDLAEIGRLAGVTELAGVARYPEPLAPAAAARLAGLPMPAASALIDSVRAVDAPGRLTLVEGAGGLLVEIADGGATLRDLAVALGAPVIVVCAAGLGTLNHTALTLEALAAAGVECAGLIIGSWPDRPGDAETFNREALAQLAPLRAVIPAGASALEPEDFAAMSAAAVNREWLSGLTR